MKKLIKQLTETFGPSGYEENVRELVQAEVKPLADEMKVDALGNLIVRTIGCLLVLPFAGYIGEWMQALHFSPASQH